MLDDAKERVRDEMGVDLDDEEWRRLDPRQYDPRRIIRDALLEPSDDGLQPEPVRAERTPYEPGRPVVFDPEAT
jgi:sec-independent protein translocase protein TatB